MSNQHVMMAVAECIKCSALREYENVQRGQIFGLLFMHLFSLSSDRACEQSTLVFQEIALCAECNRHLPLVFAHRKDVQENSDLKQTFEKAKEIAEENAQEIIREFIEMRSLSRKRKEGFAINRIFRIERG